MKLKPTPLLATLCLLGVCTTPVFADDAPASSANNDEAQLIKKLNDRTNALQQQVVALQSELKSVKATQKKQSADYKVHRVNNAVQPRTSIISDVQNVSNPATAAGTQPTPGVQGKQPMPLYYMGDQSLAIGGTPVVTSPYLGVRSAFDASDLIVNIPSANEDLRLLKQRKKIAEVYQQYQMPYPTDPLVDLSGRVEALATTQRPPSGTRTSDIDLYTAELDIAANINPWAVGFMAFNYDNTPPGQLTPPSEGPVVSNSHLFVNKAYVIIGNLASEPFYATIGQMVVPFGRYSSMMWSDPLTKTLARIKNRALLLGYDQGWSNTELNVSMFTFKGDSTTNINSSKINEFGTNLDYSVNANKWNAAIGGGYVANLADSLGMQENGADSGSGFAGFAEGTPNVSGSAAEVLVHRVPAYDIHGSVGYGDYSLLAEYVTAATAFSAANLTYNGHGAQPSALNIELSYSFPLWNKPSSISVGYGDSKDALALLLPERRYIAAFNTSVWKDTIETLEFRHDINYGAGDYATGQGYAVPATGLGRASDTVTAQIGLYF